MADAPRKPVLVGRGFLLLADFCRATGLDEATAEDLLRDGRVAGAMWTSQDSIRPFAILEDELPSRESLMAMGLQIRHDYDPESHHTEELPHAD